MMNLPLLKRVMPQQETKLYHISVKVREVHMPLYDWRGFAHAYAGNEEKIRRKAAEFFGVPLENVNVWEMKPDTLELAQVNHTYITVGLPVSESPCKNYYIKVIFREIGHSIVGAGRIRDEAFDDAIRNVTEIYNVRRGDVIIDPPPINYAWYFIPGRETKERWLGF
jgi:hypothetical protein